MSLDDFDCLELSFEGQTRTVYRKGTGPAVIIMHEVPGLHPGVVRFANAVVEQGMTVWLPSLIGTPGKKISPGYIATSMTKACVMKEFTVLAKSQNSPITTWLSQLASHAHKESGGPGVGAMGMCLTGGFALAMMLNKSVLAPVVCNPSLPFALTPGRRRDLGIDDATLTHAKTRIRNEGLCVLGLRFTGDLGVPAPRFERMKQEFGDSFLAIEIDSSLGNPHGINPLAHSVLGLNYNHSPEHPTVVAEQQTVDFLKERLLNT
jgi:dienelactone hydrolase